MSLATEYSATQVACKMNVTMDRMAELLTEIGIDPATEYLSAAQLQQLIAHLNSRQEESRRSSEEKLHKLLTNADYVVVDTCSILHDAFGSFLDNAEPVLRAADKTLLVPSVVRNELMRLGQNPEKRDLASGGARALLNAAERGLMDLRGSDELTFADNQFLTVATALRMKGAVLVITQDKTLAADLYSLNSQQSVRAGKVFVYRINQYGFLSGFPFAYAGSGSGSGSGSVSGGGYRPQPLQRTYDLIPEDNVNIAPDRMPEEGATVYAKGQAFRLGAKLASGGEGTVYELDGDSVAKIYHPARLTAWRKDKLEKMVSLRLNCEGVCWPEALLKDANGCFVGYRMKKASGVPLQRSVFMPALLSRKFPDWTKTELVRLTVTILEKITALHRSGILIGDLNPANILVTSPTDVQFVDCDSYQIEGYPCPVGTVLFTAPEIQKQSYASFLRTPGNEAFAVATLLFMLMLPGKPPYAHEGGDDLAEAITQMNFPYGCGENRGENLPDGKWRYVWSHLPRFLKEQFSETFRAGGKFSTEETRLSESEWLSSFRHYLSLLESGKLQTQDAQAGLIFPNRYKQANQKVAETRVCIEPGCGKPFDIMESERDSFLAKGMALPRRCPMCREMRKKLKNMEGSDNVESADHGGHGTGASAAGPSLSGQNVLPAGGGSVGHRTGGWGRLLHALAGRR